MIWIKLKPQEKPKAKAITPDMFDRSHLHDWHDRTLDKEPKIPEVEHYKAYIKAESYARQKRMAEYEEELRKEEYIRNHKKQHSRKTKHQSHKKRSRSRS